METHASFNPLQIGSTLQKKKEDSPQIEGHVLFQSPTNRVNTSNQLIPTNRID